jgi:acetyl-CoA synthetase
MLMRSEELLSNFDFSHLKVAASVGEPLNPEIIRWGEKKLGLKILDNWWQTETGGIMIANLPHEEIKLGSMGKALPGIEIKILKDQIAIKKGWPSLFLTYLNQEERYKKSFEGDWYLSGDRARMDNEGYIWFIGRMDDVIKTSGHLVGPFEIESLLMEHPAVLEAAVIGLPDALAGELVKAYLVLRIGYVPSEELKVEILSFIRKKAGPAIAPRIIEFCADLPKTRSGKMMRRLLRARALQLPEGDLSTLEGER